MAHIKTTLTLKNLPKMYFFLKNHFLIVLKAAVRVIYISHFYSVKEKYLNCDSGCNDFAFN